MSQLIDIKVPDIGDFSDVPVIELFVKPGDTIAVDESIAMLESDKATMDVPSSAAGVVREVLISVGDKVSEGNVLIRLEATGSGATSGNDAGAGALDKGAASGGRDDAAGAVLPPLQGKGGGGDGSGSGGTTTHLPKPSAAGSPGEVAEVKVPDIGDFTDVPVIELFVKPGDTIKLEDAIATLESDKATMDVPSSAAGIVKEVLVKVGDRVGEGKTLITVDSAASATTPPSSAGTAAAATAGSAAAAPAAAAPTSTPAPAPSPATAPAATSPPALAIGSRIHASPSVRVFARELGVDLAQVKGTGPKNRITRDDVSGFIKQAMTTGVVPGKPPASAAGSASGSALDLLPWPKVDFAKFGEIEVKPLSRIKKISGANLARNWVMIPAVTYHEDADITDLEAFRVLINKENEKAGKKLTMLAFLIKACVAGLQKFPEFNTSLDASGGELNLVYKKYFNIAFAADTPNGLVVPVVKNADQKGVFEIAAETGALAKKARDGKLGPAEMSGACFTISSLGGIGGTLFSPIVNAPEVAILGVNKSVMKPVWDGKQFVPRLTLPLSLSADHRVIDGALATRFNVYVAQLLADFRRVML